METARQQATASSQLLEGEKTTASVVVEQRAVQNRLIKRLRSLMCGLNCVECIPSTADRTFS